MAKLRFKKKTTTKFKTRPKTVKSKVTTTMVTTRKNGQQFRSHIPRDGITSMYPTKKFIKLTWTKAGALASGTTQSAFGSAPLFFLNDLNTPQSGVTGTRAQGYAEMVQAYNRYKVYGAFVDIEFNDPAIDGQHVGIRAQQFGGSDSIASEGYGTADMKRWTIVKPLNNTGSQTWYYRRYWNIGLMEGLTKLQFNANVEDYQALINASPAKRPFLEIAVANAATASSVNTQYKISITYYVQFFDRVVFANSG